MAPDGERDAAPGVPELGGELLAGRPGADHEHAPGREIAGAPVAGGVELVHGRGASAAAPGTRRHVAVAGRDDDGVRGPHAAIGHHPVAGAAARPTRSTVVRSRTGAPAA